MYNLLYLYIYHLANLTSLRDVLEIFLINVTNNSIINLLFICLNKIN